jgi:DNA mismatch repair protein MutS2
MGVMKMKIQITRLRLLDKTKHTEEKVKKKQRRGAVSANVQRRGSMELDIRGQACDDGVYEMEHFIDSAVLSGIGTVTIIHGKGTGLLRTAVRQRLKSMKCVKEFRSGLYGEGEDGVTVVTLK